MINAALGTLAGQLNQFFRRTLALSEDIVEVSNLVEADGKAAPTINNKVVLLLVNVERDTVPQSGVNKSYSGVERVVFGAAPVFLNLYVMVAANFSGKNYGEALKHLSHSVAFFQRQSVFDRHTTPDMDRRIEKLAVDIENLSVTDLSNLWSILGGKYLPSVLYKVRMIALTTDNIVAQRPVIIDPKPVDAEAG